jgi:hypothetical protein
MEIRSYFYSIIYPKILHSYFNELHNLKYFTLPDRKHQLHIFVLLMFNLFSIFYFFGTVGLSDPTRTIERHFCEQSVSPYSVWVLHTKMVLSLDAHHILLLSVESLINYVFKKNFPLITCYIENGPSYFLQCICIH